MRNRLFELVGGSTRLYVHVALPGLILLGGASIWFFLDSSALLGVSVATIWTFFGAATDMRRHWPFDIENGEAAQSFVNRITIVYATLLACVFDFENLIIATAVAFFLIHYVLLIPFQKPGRVFRRGRKLRKHREAIKLAAALPRPQSPDILWAGLSLPADAALGHFLIAGATGSGKTISLTQLMKSALPLVGRVPDTRALVYDAKQDMMSVLDSLGLQKKAVLLNPFDSRSHAWDIAADVTTPALADSVATILFPPDQESQPFFTNSARDLLYAVLLSHLRHAPLRWTLRDVLYTLGSKDRLRLVLARDADTLEIYHTYSEPESTFQNILSTVRTKARTYETVAAVWSHVPPDKTVSLKDWIKGDFIIVLGNNEAMRASIDPINRVIFKRAADLILSCSESNTRRTWVFLDEVGKAGRLHGLDDLLTKGRSKGACVVLGFQDIDSLRMPDLYGVHGANVITGQCANKAFLQLHSHSTAEWAAQLIGQAEVSEVDRSHSTSSGGGSSGTSSTDGFNERTATRLAAMIEEFFELSPPTERDPRLDGFYITSRIGAYSARYPFEMPPKSQEPDFVPRPSEQQVMAPWNAADKARLGLGGEPAPSPSKPTPETKPSSLDDFRRLSRDSV